MTAATLAWSALGAGLFVASGLIVAVTVTRVVLHQEHLCDLSGSYPNKSHKWPSSLAVASVALVWICWALALGQLLGALALLRRGPLLVAAVASAAAGHFLSRRLPAGQPGDRISEPGGTAAPADRAEAGGPQAGEAGMPEAREGGGPQPREAGGPQAGGPQAGGPQAGGPQAGGTQAGDGDGTVMVTATAVLVGLVAALWLARTVIAVHGGIADPDSLGYHLPFTNTFAQSGVADQHRFVYPSLPVHFYPANDELLSAVALVLTRSVAFAAVKNLLFGALALVAAHALGRRFRAGAAAVAGAAIVLGLPIVAFTQPGEAVNDSLLLFVLLAAVAVLAYAGERPAPYLLAMAGAGVMLGVKFSAVIPAVGLAGLALVLLYQRLRQHRPRWAVAGGLAGLAMGGSWYLRNAITYGNPIPPARLALGSLHLRQIVTPESRKSFSVLGFLIHGRFLGVFIRGSVRGLGPMVVVVAGLCIYGTVAGLRSRDPFRRGLGILGLVCLIGYLATPASAYGVGPASAGAFVINLHYAAPALMVGMVSAGIALASWRRAWLLAAMGWLVVAAGITSGRRIAFWSPGIGGAGFVVLLAGSLAATAAVWAWAPPSRRCPPCPPRASWPTWASRPSRRSAVVAGAFGAAGAVLVAVLLIAGRYPSMPSSDPVERWAASVSGARIAAWVPDISWLYGPGSRNRPVTLTRLVDGAPVALDTCPAWMQAVRQGHYPYSAVIPRTTWYHWLTADPAFRLVAQNDFAAVFAVVGQPDVSCGAAR